MKKVAIFIDWDNFRKELEKVITNTNTQLVDFDYNFVKVFFQMIYLILFDYLNY